MAPRVNRKILEKYFDFHNDNAKCKRCSRFLKCDRMFNLKTHVFKVHKISKDEFAHDKGVICNSVNHNKNKNKKNRKQVIKVEISKKQLFRSYIGLVIEDSIPLNILNSDNLKNIVDPICRGLSVKYSKKVALNSSHCEKFLQLISDILRDSIKIELNQRLLSLKIDSATCLSRSLFGISAQFIKDNEIQSRILGMMELKGVGGSSSRNLATEMLNTLTKVGVNLNQIVSVTSDNGANMIRTFEDAHDTDDGNDIYLKNIEMFEDFSQIHVDDIQINRYAAHTVQLCVFDVMRDIEIKNFLLSCRNLVKLIRKPANVYSEIFEHKSLTVPQLDFPAIWGSSYNMVMSLKNAKPDLVEVEPVKNESIDENVELNDSFWDFVEAYCVAFKPLQHTIVKLQQEQLHYGDFYAEWLKCKICTEKILENDDKTYTGKIAKILLQSMENRTIELLNNENLIACLYLDPRFNHTLTVTQKREAATYLKKLYERLKNISSHVDPKNSTESSVSSLESKQYSQKANEFLNEYLAQNFLHTSNENIDIHTKIDNLKLKFSRVDINVLHFWGDKQYSDPELYALANICFAVPPTQVPMGRVFSSLKRILADNRHRIDQDTLENILLVKLNPTCLDEAINDLPLFEDDA